LSEEEQLIEINTVKRWQRSVSNAAFKGFFQDAIRAIDKKL